MAQPLRNIQNTYDELLKNHQGGGFLVLPSGIDIDSEPITGTQKHPDLKPFEISIYSQDEDVEKVTMRFLINPSDISFGQTFVSSDSYTREGWVSSIWGKNQMTINANCSTAAFYVYGVGVSNYLRNFSIAFKNFISFVGIFKNGGYYFYRGEGNKDLFNNDPGRVISVMDLIKVSYDGAEYIGSFASLTVDESSETPYNIKFNFEFLVSGMRGEDAEGHLRRCSLDYGCNTDTTYNIRTQGKYDFSEIASLDIRQLTQTFSNYQKSSDYSDEFIENLAPRYKAQVMAKNNNLTLINYPKLTETSFKAVLSYKDLIIEASQEYNVPPDLLAAMMDQESRGVNGRTSSAGAEGLMQIIPKTQKALGVTDPFDPRQSIFGAAKLMRENLDIFPGREDLAVAAYNAGPDAIIKAKYNIPSGDGYAETRQYVPEVFYRRQRFTNQF